MKTQKVDIDCHTCKGFGDVYVDHMFDPDDKSTSCHVCGGSGLLTVDAEDHLQEELAQLAGAIEVIENKLKSCGLSTSEIRDYIISQTKDIAD